MNNYISKLDIFNLILWLIPVSLYFFNYNIQSINYVIFLLVTFLTISNINRFNYFLHLPFIFLLSPLSKSITFLDANLLISDFSIIFYLISFCLFKFNFLMNKIFSKKYFILFSFIFIQTVINYIFFERINDKSIYYLLIIIISFFCLESFEIDLETKKKFNLYFFTGVFYSSILLLLASYKGINLINFSYNYDSIFQISSYEEIRRFSYFYPGLNILIGIAISRILITLLNFEFINFKVITLLFILSIYLSTIYFTLNKTVVFSIPISIFAFYLLKSLHLNIKFLGKFINLFFLSLTILVIFNLFDLFSQQISQFLKFSTLQYRYEMAINSISIIFFNPLSLILGYGFNFIESNNELSTLFTRHSITMIENSLDSTIVIYLIEFGIIIFTYFLIKYFKLISQTIFSIKNKNDISLINEYNLNLISLLFINF